MKNWQKLKENPQLWKQFFVREQTIRAIRLFFEKQKFHEVETPLLIAHPPAESYVDVFETTLFDRYRKPTNAYLSTSPEIPLKKLLVAGIGNCFALTKSFRNMETQSTTHNPEFTILEWYRVGAAYEAIMKDCEDLVTSLVQALTGTSTVTYQGQRIDVAAPWERLTVANAFERYAHIDIDTLFDFDSLRQVSAHKGYSVDETTTWEQLYNQIFLNEVETHLGKTKPTILTEFPSSVAALAKLKPDDPRVALRFEFYIGGLELGDCYTELTDAIEQEKRFDKELVEIVRLGKTAYEYDHDFIEALKVGLPESSGIAVGVDRLIMLLANVTDIADIMYFPASQEFSK